MRPSMRLRFGCSSIAQRSSELLGRPDSSVGLPAAASSRRSGQSGTAGLERGSTVRSWRWCSCSARGCSTDRTATSSTISAPDAGTVSEACFHSATTISPRTTSVPRGAGSATDSSRAPTRLGHAARSITSPGFLVEAVTLNSVMRCRSSDPPAASWRSGGPLARGLARSDGSRLMLGLVAG